MADCKIFANIIEDSAREQIDTLITQSAFKNSKIRIMPDVHAGAGCVIGFTGNLGDKVIPNLVGVDIGCGMRVIKLNKKCDEIDLQKFDETVHDCIPAGFSLRPNEYYPGLAISWYRYMYCFPHIKEYANRFDLSIGTLGGGNHFIELDKDEEDNVYLVIHTGSRNLGVQVAKYYQNLAIATKSGLKEAYDSVVKDIIIRYKEAGRTQDISSAIMEVKSLYNMAQVPNELAYLTHKNRDNYLHDMKLCQQYARSNRMVIESILLDEMNWDSLESFETVHNYIDNLNIIRKGAVAAHAGQKLLIPMNMRDGSLLCIGKGNPEWNESAPHGAGRLMSRNVAKKSINIEDYKKSMNGIYTTSVDMTTIDEAPMAYKPIETIIEQIHDTVDIVSVLKPIYNFKAGEE